MQDPMGRRVPSIVDVLLYLVGVAGLAAGITLVFLGMRAVMDIGGYCAEGGPYVIGTHCPDGVALATFLGVWGGLGFAFLAAWKGLAVGGGASSVVFLAWPALFGALGFNFLQYGFDPPGDEPGWEWGWLLCGVAFAAAAIGPLLLGGWAARSSDPNPAARLTRAAPGGARLDASMRRVREDREARRTAIPPLAPSMLDLAEDAAAEAGAGEGDAVPEALVDGLERLAALHRAGSLTDEEYARAKAELLERAGA